MLPSEVLSLLLRARALALLVIIPGCDRQPDTSSRPVVRQQSDKPRAREAHVPRRQDQDRELIAIIEAAFARHQVPARNRPVYLALAQLESNFTVDQVSPAGALGLFQITPVTVMSILETHPELERGKVPVFNPMVKGTRRILPRGADRRYPLRVMRWYAARLRRARESLRQSVDDDRRYHEKLRQLDVRFDPDANARLAVYHLEQLRKGFFGRRRCYRYRGTDAAHKGKKLCGSFSGRHATLLAAAGYHLGVGAVENMLAVSQARSIDRYVESLKKAKEPMYRRNRYYLAKLRRLSRTYAALLRKGPLEREAVARAFPRQPALARRLFRRYAVTPSR